MSTTTCPNCHASLPAGAAFCTSCGHRMDAVDDATRVEATGLNDETRTFDRPDMAPPAPPAPAGDSWGAPPAPPASGGDWQGAGGQAAPEQNWGAPGGQTWGGQQANEQQNWGQGQSGQGSPNEQPSWGAPSQGGFQNTGQQAWGQAPGQQQQQQQQQQPWGAQQQAGQPGAWGATGTDPGGAPATGTWGAPETPAASGGAKSPIAGALGVLSGIGTLVGVFLAWYTVKIGNPLEETSISAWKIFSGVDLKAQTQSFTVDNKVDPVALLILGIVLVGLGLLAFMGQGKAASIGLLVVGIAVVVIAFRGWMTMSSVADDKFTSAEGVDGGLGLYLTYATGGLAILGGIAGFLTGKKKA